jgi:polysaccharide pyruvyl transferase WcaK-like protein
MAALFVLQAMPGPVRQRVAGMMLDRLVRRRLEPRWAQVLSDADAVVIGGGGIFADSDLNFPMKIGAALRMAAERGLPVAVHAVGVSPGWSPRGRALLGRGLLGARLASLTLRDTGGLAMWARELGAYALPVPGIAPDPALTLGDHMAMGARDPAGRTIGLCITSPAALRYHSDKAPRRDMADWYLGLAGELHLRGYRVQGFTTGAVEDGVFAQRLAQDFTRCTGGGTIAQPASAQEMVTLIHACRAVVSHRLHAIIVAHVGGIPALALAWDGKMAGQMAMMGHADRLVDPAGLEPLQAADLVERIMAQGIDTDRRDALVEEARRGTRRLARALREAVGAEAGAQEAVERKAVVRDDA